VAAWDRREDETPKAYAAFAVYVQMPVRERGIDAAWRESAANTRPNRAQIAPRHWYTWSSAYDWVARSAAYDSYLAEQDRLLWEERRRAMREREWERGDALHDLVAQALPSATQFIHAQRQFIAGRDGQPDREVITMSFDVTGLSKVSIDASKLQRLATNEPTERTVNDLSGSALDALIARELARVADGGQAGDGGQAAGDADAEGNPDL
jgi:hypothetical protein